MRERKPNRLKHYNYSQGGYYFITICTYKRRIVFGKASIKGVELNDYGKIADKCMVELPKHVKGIEIHEYIIMPNHIHAIIVGTRHALSLRDRRNNVLSVAVGSFKSAVTKHIKRKGPYSTFKWQRSFYDHIIRTEKAYLKYREYIRTNPEKWGDDVENTGGDAEKYYKKIIE